MTSKTGKRPLRSLTAHEKLEAIRRVHDGESKASVARDIGVPESTLRGWCKNEDKISYLSRQSSPDTDESLDQNKKPKIEELPTQPFNLSIKSSGGSFSEISPQDLSKTALDLKVATKETPKSANSISERERNRAELARLSVELGLNRPEIFMSTAKNNAANLNDLTANIALLNQWNSIVLQQQQQQTVSQQQVHIKTSAPTDTTNLLSTSMSNNLLTTVDQEKSKHLPKEKASVQESVWYWLRQQSMLGLNQQQTTAAVPNLQSTNSIPIATTTPTTTRISNTSPNLNGMSSDQNSWFWRWYKQYSQAYTHFTQQQIPAQDTKPILYQQLTKDHISPPITPSPPHCDQQNAENLSLKDEKPKSPMEKAANKRSVLDNLLFNNNNNVSLNKRDEREEESNLTHSEAVEHGEIFLKWLEAYSDPSVTTVHIMQFRNLLNNVKSGADKKNGQVQNKTKVKRK